MTERGKIMDWIIQISNNDNCIKDVLINGNNIVVEIELWNGDDKKIVFNNYRAIKEKCSIGETIGDVIVNTDSLLFKELKEDILNGDGSIEEIDNIKSFKFLSIWDDTVLLDILAESVVID